MDTQVCFGIEAVHSILRLVIFSPLLSLPHPLLPLPNRFERLEDQLNDLTELHQHETSNLKQELASIEEKVAYQAYERARDIQVCTHTHIYKHALCKSI